MKLRKLIRKQIYINTSGALNSRKYRMLSNNKCAWIISKIKKDIQIADNEEHVDSFLK